MTTDWLGGGLIVALAAVLWLIYLLPTWFRRNEFLSTERNVVRLQQTLRILAETSEVPDEVHVEANARSVAEQQRVLKKANAQNLLAERAGLQTLIEQGRAAQAAALSRNLEDASSADSGEHETIVLAPRPPALTFRQASLKLRRARAATSGILLLALAVAVLGGVQVAVNGAWVVLVVGLIAATLCVTRLGRLARDGRALQSRGIAGESAATAPVSGAGRDSARASRVPEYVFADEDVALSAAGSTGYAAEVVDGPDAGVVVDEGMTLADDGSGWTPVPLPKPLYVGHRRIDGDMPVSAYVAETAERAEQALRAAARDSEQALRRNQRAETAVDVPEELLHTGTTEAPTVTLPPLPQAAPSRFASMGVIDAAETGAIDVDRVLARRRAG
ncbi:hypothetical protein B7R54_12475 [Subtercola boreus]|uniref:Large exoprotein n=1 Tax=Subtercola boreus TaxID=120213 RepID=A0A3E0VJW3_9MICO|nr:hypothetical protein [Subtercola boreus]RFA09925.1 hypothetical protein B7R54_12475 [Subtercola boreus]TQL52936.1 hypothetical protein FB464_0426 [Subtercola boreus]